MTYNSLLNLQVDLRQVKVKSWQVAWTGCTTRTAHLWSLLFTSFFISCAKSEMSPCMWPSPAILHLAYICLKCVSHQLNFPMVKGKWRKHSFCLWSSSYRRAPAEVILAANISLVAARHTGGSWFLLKNMVNAFNLDSVVVLNLSQCGMLSAVYNFANMNKTARHDFSSVIWYRSWASQGWLLELLFELAPGGYFDSFCILGVLRQPSLKKGSK